MWSEENYEDLDGHAVGFVSEDQRSDQRVIACDVLTNCRECLHSLDAIFFPTDCVPNKRNQKLIPDAQIHRCVNNPRFLHREQNNSAVCGTLLDIQIENKFR